MINLLKIIGFEPSKRFYGGDNYEMKFRGYSIIYVVNKKTFELIRKEETSHGTYYSECDVENCINKKALKHYLLCKALNEIDNKDYGIPNYKNNISGILLHMFYSKSSKLPIDEFINASGTQFDIAEQYYKGLR